MSNFKSAQRTLQKLQSLEDVFNHWIGMDRFLSNTITSTQPSFPPYDVVQFGDNYNIIVALAGYKATDIEIKQEGEQLTISSIEKPTDVTPEDTKYIHKGIAKRMFKLMFNISPEIRVNESTLVDGMLTIKMYHEVPESKQPKLIPILSS